MSPDDEEPGPVPLKIVVAGGVGAGKTTFVQTVAQLAPPGGPVEVTSMDVDDPRGGSGGAPASVPVDLTRVGVGGSQILYLIGMPGQDRLSFTWDELVRGAVGGVVLVDPSRLEASFEVLDFFESCGVPFVVAVNAFPGADRFRPADVHEALALRRGVPVLPMDARVRSSCLSTIIRLVEHTLDRAVVVRFPGSRRPVSR